jgi:hypothetical protein
LSSSTHYQFAVSASTRGGYGTAATVTVWTEVTQPGIPPAPLFVDAEPTTVTLLLQPLAAATAVTTATPAVQATYFVIVNQLSNSGSSSSSRRKRSDDVFERRDVEFFHRGEIRL